MKGIMKKLFGGDAKEVEVELKVSYDLNVGMVPHAIIIRVGDEIIPAKIKITDIGIEEGELPEYGMKQVSEGRERTLPEPESVKLNPLVENNPETAWHVKQG